MSVGSAQREMVVATQEADTPLLKLGWRFISAFYTTVLSTALITAAIAWLAGDPLHVDDMLFAVVVGLGAINVTGAWALLRPLSSSGKVPNRRQRAGRWLQKLPILTAAWGMVLVATSMTGHHLVTHVTSQASSIWELLEIVMPLGFILAYAALLGLFLYFTVGALVVRARRYDPWLSTLEIQPKGHLGLRVLVAIVATSVVPLSLAIAHREIAAHSPGMHTMDVRTFLMFDLAAALLAIGSAVWFFSQALAQPVELLMRAMTRFQSGDFSTRAQALTDDEIGGLAVGFNQMAEEVSDRAFVNRTLGRFVPEAVVAAVLNDRGVVLPRVQEATILYTDIEGFTTLCEHLSPPTIMSMLNEYFAALSGIIRQYGGVITQFQGDALLVTFNLPVTDPDHALNAVRSALDIQALLATRHFTGDVRLPTRIGINTGSVVGGTVGDDTRLGYTVHGDAVNVAQRLEQANKQTGTRILLSTRTAELVGDSLSLRFLSEVALSGRTTPVDVYTPAKDPTDKE